tara:strand:+ start:304 stop:531 length:228 start_codon:yes stop_codon:yes gene_type:complete
VFATEYEDRFIGWIHILVTPKIGKWKKRHLFVDEMWVMPDYRRKGVAICMRNMVLKQSVNVFSWKNPVDKNPAKH